MSTKTKLIIALISAIVLFFVGFFVGRSTLNTTTKTKTEYIALPSISGDIEISEPTVINIPNKPIWLYDTVKIAGDTVIQKVDTAAILHDWILERTYNNVAFDNDTIGKLDITTKVQYNKLKSQTWNYAPIQKQTTTTKYVEPRYQMFMLVGANSDKTAEAQIGTFIHKFGISYDININKLNSDIKYTHGLKVGIKF